MKKQKKHKINKENNYEYIYGYIFNVFKNDASVKKSRHNSNEIHHVLVIDILMSMTLSKYCDIIIGSRVLKVKSQFVKKFLSIPYLIK